MSVPVRALLPEEHFEQLYRLGERHDVTVGALVTELVRRHLTGECQQPKQLHDGKPLAPAVIADIVALHGEGRSDAAIARELGISGQTVRRYRRDAGLPVNVQNTRLPPETVTQIRALHAEGHGDREIGRRLQLSNKRIGNYRNALGLPKNGKGGRPRKHPPTYPLADPAQAGADTREKTT